MKLRFRASAPKFKLKTSHKKAERQEQVPEEDAGKKTKAERRRIRKRHEKVKLMDKGDGRVKK